MAKKAQLVCCLIRRVECLVYQSPLNGTLEQGELMVCINILHISTKLVCCYFQRVSEWEAGESVSRKR